eukprot:1003205-Pleurochrysis_carterae.AAC.3
MWSITAAPTQSPVTLTTVRIESSSQSIAIANEASRLTVCVSGTPAASITNISVATPEDGMGDDPTDSTAHMIATTRVSMGERLWPDTKAIHNTMRGRSSAEPSMLIVQPRGRTY